MDYRLATEKDLTQLVEMRWDFRTEYIVPEGAMSKADFMAGCLDIFRRGLAEGRWVVWVAEEDGCIVSHAFVQRIEKLPSLKALQRQYGYVSNVYTRPAYRGQGIGAELMKRVEEWAQQQDFEFLLLWPSQRAIPFYERNGFSRSTQVMEYHLQED
jgi:GNAT superfamily N-acetyltransferase